MEGSEWKGGYLDEPYREALAAELKTRFTYHTPKRGQPERYQALRASAHNLAKMIADECPVSREREEAFKNLEQVVMWANAAIARREE